MYFEGLVIVCGSRKAPTFLRATQLYWQRQTGPIVYPEPLSNPRESPAEQPHWHAVTHAILPFIRSTDTTNAEHEPTRFTTTNASFKTPVTPTTASTVKSPKLFRAAALEHRYRQQGQAIAPVRLTWGVRIAAGVTLACILLLAIWTSTWEITLPDHPPQTLWQWLTQQVTT